VCLMARDYDKSAIKSSKYQLKMRLSSLSLELYLLFF
jgi:hypothetical protein